MGCVPCRAAGSRRAKGNNMVILEEPYASPLLVEWLATSRHPVLDNEFARGLSAPAPLSLVSPEDCARRIAVGERVYTSSENALSWIAEHVDAPELNRVASLLKDKVAVRKLLAPLNPDLFFETFTREELAHVDVSSLPLPVVLKPSVGFCSMGVYAIGDAADWAEALADIERCEAVWAQRYPESVIDARDYIVEGYLDGVEYAIDMFYDSEGKARVLNVLRHDFAGPEDTSDRMYVTSREIVLEMAPLFESWLDRANVYLAARDFPVHVEVRVDGGNVAPIEFNPLRFAGLGGTDVAYLGWGLRTYEAYLNDAAVDLEALTASAAGKVYSMSLLNPAPGADLSRPFDYDAFAARFTNVLALRRFDVDVTGSYGFLFLETDKTSAGELDYLLRSDLLEFVR